MNRDLPINISLVIPCFNEEGGLGELLRRCRAVIGAYGDSAEILLVDDGSQDGTWAGIEKAHQEDSRVRGIRLSRNFGHQLALSAGLDHCRGARVFVLDADLQDPPELLPDMMKIMDAGADVVYGVRRRRAGVSLWKKICYRLYYRLLKIVGGELVQLDAGDYRLLSRRVVDLLRTMPESQRFLRGMISWLGFSQVPLEYSRNARHEGEPKYTLAKLMRLALDGVMSFSIQPLRLAVFLGSILALFSLLGMVYIFVGVLFYAKTPPGWGSIMVVMLFMGALQLLMIGVVGEYVGRLFLESKKRPIYVVSQDTLSGGGKEAA